MTFFERRFVGSSLIATFVVEAAILLILIAASHTGAHPPPPAGEKLSLAGPIAFGGFIAAVIASVLSSAFCRANVIRDLLCTRPGSRVRFAAQIVGIDVAAIAIVWAGSFVLLGVVPLVFTPGLGINSLAFDDATARTAVEVIASLLAIYGFGIGISFGLKASAASLSLAGWAVFVGSLVVGFTGTIPLVLAGRSVLKSVGRHVEAAGSAFAAAPDYHPFFIPDPIVGTLLAFAVGIAGIAVATTSWQRVRF